MKDYKELNKLWKKFVFNENLWIDKLILAEDDRTEFKKFQAASEKAGLADRDRKIDKDEAPVDLGGDTGWAHITRGALLGPITNEADTLSPPRSAYGGYGARRGKNVHRAIDIGSFGDPVHAIAEGVIQMVRPGNEWNGYAGWFLKYLAVPAVTEKEWIFFGKGGIQLDIPKEINQGNFDALKDEVLYISKITDKKGRILNALRDVRPFLKIQSMKNAGGVIHRAIHAGAYIIIKHKRFQITSHYMHLGSINSGISQGAKITAGQVIGAVGKTGIFDPPDAGGPPHLHFEVRSMGKNPRYLDFRRFYSNRN